MIRLYYVPIRPVSRVDLRQRSIWKVIPLCDTYVVCSGLLVASWRSRPFKLSTIEAFRGIAAVAVVLSHSARHVDKAYGEPALIAAFQVGHAGVDLFFVISGFIILFVHHGDVGKPGRLSTYAQRRFTRVMPLYWVALALSLVLGLVGSGPPPSLQSLLLSASLLPTTQEPLLGVAWTLQYEVVFYVVFALLIIWRTAGLVLLTAWFCVTALSTIGMHATSLPGSLSGAYGIEFFFGMAAAMFVVRRQVPAPLLILISGLAMFGTAMILESTSLMDGYADGTRLVYGVSAAFVVAGAAAAERAGKLVVHHRFRLLGGASYSIYLFQFVFIGIAWKAWLWLRLGSFLSHDILFITLAGSAVGGGVLVSRFVEQPLLRQLRRRLSPVSSSAPFRVAVSQDS